jgi:putative oxidoreductase
MRAVRTAARAMLAGVFVVHGVRGAMNPDPLVSEATPVTHRLGPALQRIHPSLPSDPRTLVRIDGAVKLVCGLLLLTPARRPAALVLAGTMVSTTLAAHRADDAQQPGGGHQWDQFLKDLGLTGGLLLAALDTEGRPGLGWRTSHLMSDANRSLHRRAKHTRARVRHAARANPIGRRLPGGP